MPRVHIVGYGIVGSFLADIYKSYGFNVGVSDIDEKALRAAMERGYATENSEELASKSDMVVVSVTMGEQENVIRQLGPHLKPGSAMLSTNSRMVNVENAMLQSAHNEVEVIAMHPVFRPTPAVGFENQVVALHTARPPKGGKWTRQMEKFCMERKR